MLGLNNKKYISLKEATKISGYAPDYIGWLIRKRKIKGQKVYQNISWQVSKQGLIEYCRKTGREIKNLDTREIYISLKEATKISGYAPDYIGYLIRKGEISGKKICPYFMWVTTEDALKEYQTSKIKHQRLTRKESFSWTKILNLSLKTARYVSIVVLLIAAFIISSNLVFKDALVEAEEQIRIFPISYSSEWQNPEAMFIKDLEPTANLEEFNTENSVYPLITIEETSFPAGAEEIILEATSTEEEIIQPTSTEPLIPEATTTEGIISTTTSDLATTSETTTTEEISTTTQESVISSTTSEETATTSEENTTTTQSKIDEKSFFAKVWLKFKNLFSEEAKAETDEDLFPEGPLISVEKTLEVFNFPVLDNLKEKEPQNIQLKISFANKKDPGGKLFIDYYFQDSWQNLDTLDLNEENSNAISGDYFSYDLPFLENWDDFENLRIKFVYSGLPALNTENPTVFLDAVWLEIDFQEGNEIKFINPREKFWSNEEPQFILPKIKVESLIDKIKIFLWPESLFENITLTGPDDSEVSANIVLNENDENYIIKIEKLTDFQPGKYVFEVKIRSLDEIYTATTEFTWEEEKKEEKKQEETRTPEKRLLFFLDSVPLRSKKVLPWHPGDFQSETQRENDDINISVLLNDKDSGIIFGGNCQKEYYVVLGFRNAEDYEKSPASFIYNKAFPCEGGVFQYELKDLSLNLANGTYYFLVAEQGESGPWQPISAIQAVRIEAEYK